MSERPEPRAVVVTWAETQGLTVLEQARALARVGVNQARARDLFRALVDGAGSPGELETAALLFYAIAFELERRRDPGVTWEEAQTWDVKLDTTPDPMIEAEARAAVETAIATGLSPAEAGNLTMAQLDAYRHVAAQREREARRPGRRRRASA